VNHSAELSDEIWTELGEHMNIALNYLSPSVDEALLKIFRSRPQWQKEFPKEWVVMGPERLNSVDKPITVAQAGDQAKISGKNSQPKNSYFQALVSLGLRQALGSEVLRNAKDVSMEFVTVNPGEFTMGSPDGSNPKQPAEEDRFSNEGQRVVKITKSFEIAKTDITQLEFFWSRVPILPISRRQKILIQWNLTECNSVPIVRWRTSPGGPP